MICFEKRKNNNESIEIFIYCIKKIGMKLIPKLHTNSKSKNTQRKENMLKRKENGTSDLALSQKLGGKHQQYRI